MTIVAGFFVRDGVLMCADTLHSGTGANVYESKLHPLLTDHVRVIFSFSGNAPFATSVIQDCSRALRNTKPSQFKGHSDVADVVREVLNREYRRLVYDRPDRNYDIHWGFR